MFGNRHILRIEERELHPNQYDLLEAAGIRHPVLFDDPKDIDRPVLVKVLEAERGFERAFFIARTPQEFERIAEARIASGVFTEASLEAATIEEYVLGALVNFNFYYSPLADRLELLGTDTRRQTNVSGLANVPANMQEAVVQAIPLKFEEAGHVAVTVLESMLEMVFEAGERFVAAAKEHYAPGVIGPFALQRHHRAGPAEERHGGGGRQPAGPGQPGHRGDTVRRLPARPLDPGRRADRDGAPGGCVFGAAERGTYVARARYRWPRISVNEGCERRVGHTEETQFWQHRFESDATT